jgi:hypothetical protein
MSVIHVNNQIIIEPAHKGILYVPYYDPRIVYGHWHWRNHPPVYWAPSPYYARRNHAHFYWGSGVQITFNYYFTTFNWHKRNVIVVNHHHSHDYRHRERIISSHGARRWQHKSQPHHRVREGNTHTKQRDQHRTPSHLPSKNIQSHEHRQKIENKIDRNRERNNSQIDQQEKRRQLLENKSDRNKESNHSQIDRQNKHSDRHIKGEQAIDSKLKINQQENRRQLIENKSERNRERNHSQIVQPETRRQLIDNKSVRGSSPVDQQNKQQDRQVKSHQSIERRVKIDQQENKQSAHKEDRPRHKKAESAQR